MKILKKVKKVPRAYQFEIDHNPYEILSYNNTSTLGKAIVFPLFHYQGEQQYIDLLNPILEQGYHVIVIKFLNYGDRVLFFNYYAKVLSRLITDIIQHKIIKNESIIFMGFGVGAYLASYMQQAKLKGITKFILISPVNKYKDEYMISHEIANFKIPTYIFFGQTDQANTVESRFAIYQQGKDNPKVTFTSYAMSGYFLYYRRDIDNELEDHYHREDYDLFVGETRTGKLPTIVEYNEKFYHHLFLILEDKPLPKRIALLTDVFPLFTNGVSTVVNLLKDELKNYGYEVYTVAMWDKRESFDKVPEDCVPILGGPARFVMGHKDLHMLKTFAFQRNAKILALFGFDYLHLHTEYSMSQIAIYLSKYTGVNLVYTYHTLWKMYYEQKFGKFAGDITYTAAKELLFSKIYKESKTITVPSLKSYEILTKDTKAKDIRVIPSSIDMNRFKMSREDLNEVSKLREKYDLKNKKVLGYVGRVSTEKNIVETLQYVADIKNEIPNIVFLIVGVGDAVKLLKKTVKKLEIEDSVIFVGEVENTKLKYYYSLFDVFVTASNFETQGLTYFEAACSGTLILAKKDKALEGIFEDGVNAYIYEDFYQWVEKMEKALFKNNKKIVDNAKVMMKQFSPDKWSKKILDIYLEINPSKKK